jgi:hypothetical protein
LGNQSLLKTEESLSSSWSSKQNRNSNHSPRKKHPSSAGFSKAITNRFKERSDLPHSNPPPYSSESDTRLPVRSQGFYRSPPLRAFARCRVLVLSQLAWHQVFAVCRQCVLSLIKSRSNSARDAKIWKISFPLFPFEVQTKHSLIHHSR